jgi:hypothetical protein
MVRMLHFLIFLARSVCKLVVLWWVWSVRVLVRDVLPAVLVEPQRTAFIPWMRGVSRSAVFYRATYWKRKPDGAREGGLQLARELPAAGYRKIADCFNLQQAALHGNS